jgi:anti-sigma factor RsiW
MQFKTFYKRKTNPCSIIRERFSEYVDRMLSYEEQLEVHEHVRLCEECTKELDALCKTVSLLTDFRQELPSAINTFRVPRTIFAAVEYFPSLQQREESRFSWSFLAPYFTAFVVLCLVVSSFVLGGQRSVHPHYNPSNYVEVLGR